MWLQARKLGYRHACNGSIGVDTRAPRMPHSMCATTVGVLHVRVCQLRRRIPRLTHLEPSSLHKLNID